MHILNLKKGFAPCGPGTLELSRSRVFSGGEVDLQLLALIPRPTETLITTRLNSSDDVMELLMATDALRELGADTLHLFIPYLPYARQDRVVRDGEAFSLRVFADLINAQGYASVRVFDPHSHVGSALLRRSKVITNHAFVGQVLAGRADYWLLSPDSGAYSKVSALAKAIGYDGDIALCNKIRVGDGTIDAVTVTVTDFDGKDVFIVDDICDGGRTFIALAKEIRTRNAGAINLIVSHAIFSYGEQVLKDGGIDHVYTTDSFKLIGSPFVTQVKLCIHI